MPIAIPSGTATEPWKVKPPPRLFDIALATGSGSDALSDAEKRNAPAPPARVFYAPTGLRPPHQRGPAAQGHTPLCSRATSFVPAGHSTASQGIPGHTTVMLCCLPTAYTGDALIHLLKSKGYSEVVDFVYVPINFTTMLGTGYAVVNLTSSAWAMRFMLEFDGLDDWRPFDISKTACVVRWSRYQGCHVNTARYQNSPITGPEVPAFCKPILLKDGVRVLCPEPKKLRKLRALQPPAGSGRA